MLAAMISPSSTPISPAIYSLRKLYGTQVGRKPIPQVPGTEVDDEVEPFFFHTGVNAPETGWVGEKDGLRVTHGHVGLVGGVSIFPVHPDDLLDLRFQILAIGVVLTWLSCRGHEVGEIGLEIALGHGIRDTQGRRNVRQQAVSRQGT